MSQKQAKRIRRLECRVECLEKLLTPQLGILQDRVFQAENRLDDMVLDAGWIPVRPASGILRRIKDFWGKKKHSRDSQDIEAREDAS